MPTARWGAASGVIDGKLYVVGGQGAILQLDMLEVYDPATDTWTTKAPMPTARFAPAAGVIDGKLYVAGGLVTPVTVVSRLEVYDPTTDTWTTKADMPAPRQSSGAAVIEGKLYVGGGSTSCCIVGTLEVYDPATDTWSTKASLPTPRDELTNSTGVIGGLWHVVGGRLSQFGGAQTNILEIYDPATDSWAAGPSMPTAREQAAAGVIDNRLYVAGGRNDQGMLVATLEVFVPPAAEITAAIDIKPGSFPNSINPKSRGVIPVAILTTDTFDAATVDPSTVVFGKTGTEAAPVHFALEDVDGDGDTDMILHFNTQATGIQCGDTSASLTGETFSGQMIQGSDSVNTVGCK